PTCHHTGSLKVHTAEDGLSVRIDMDKHIFYLVISIDEHDFDIGCDIMPFTHFDIWIDTDFNIDDDIASMCAGIYLIDPQNTTNIVHGFRINLYFFTIKHFFHDNEG